MIENKKIVVAGFAVTGRAVVDFLREYPCSVTVSDARHETEFGDLPKQYHGVKFEFGELRPGTFAGADLIILSPGIPDTTPAVAEARRLSIPVISEIELAFHYLKGTIIGITGTNGKSTTTELTGAILKQGDRRTFVCGNIGEPLISFCKDSQPADFYAVELSSFQLETIDKFRPHIAAILNLAEDHLDRYPSVEPYFRAKMRIFENQRANDFAVLNYDNSYLRENSYAISSNHFWFSRKEATPAGVYASGDLIKSVSGASIANFGLGRLKGVHNLENTLCAVSIAVLCGISPKNIQVALEQFTGLPHRMELVAEGHGIRYYDDSKATNADAVVKSLESFPANVILIMGGKDKGCDYTVLNDLVSSKVKNLLLIGEAKQRIADVLGKVKEPQNFDSLESAVDYATKVGQPGDVVLLSPACSSFDMFKDYKDRGKKFKLAARDAIGRKEGGPG